MERYYTRVCNFYYGKESELLVKKNKTIPLNGNKKLSFDHIEIISRSSKKKFHIDKIKSLSKFLKKQIISDLKKIKLKKKNFANLNFLKIPNIMGVLNLTPDSFSDGGKFNKNNEGLKHALMMFKSGANIIDVGGESTRPGSKTINPKLEWKRIKTIIKNFKKEFKRINLSIDTRKSEVMINSIKYKADIINDVSGFEFDEKSLTQMRGLKVAKVLHHMQGTPNTMQINPKYKNVLLDVYDYFENRLEKFGDKKIILDPGIGFGKNLKHNLTLISKISLFHSLGLPILVGTSRKRFISQISGVNDSKERIGGTLASVLFLLSQGVQIFRVHNVNEVKQGILVFKKILSNFDN